MKKLIYIFLLSTCPLFGQTASHRIGQVIVKGNGIAANVSPYASIKVCVVGTQCSVISPVYPTSSLTTALPQPLTADASGNYNYWTGASCVDEKISSPGQESLLLQSVCPSSGASVKILSVGNLAPLFTSSVTNPTTTPAISFTASTAPINSVFAGAPSGSAVAPTFQTSPTFSAANLTSFPTFNQNTTGTSAGLTGSPAITVSNVTDSVLTPGQCVQAGTGGILTSGCGSGGTATLAVAAGAGTGATINCVASYSCNANYGTVSLTVGSSPTTGIQFTVTAASAYATFPSCSLGSATSTTASSLGTLMPYAVGTSTTVASFGLNTPTAGTYTLSYRCN